MTPAPWPPWPPSPWPPARPLRHGRVPPRGPKPPPKKALGHMYGL